ncbi:hypothetical protein CJ030_MR0G005437 [Morella rubra]|uniref:Uncharacterized protein n=1 Tax=Morella rubra TaxID=262757 RepID=A0A6A1UL13_9ROSI|nr:hypothetical protein CJ030_MR0G005437 [Morella rubra]
MTSSVEIRNDDQPSLVMNLELVPNTNTVIVPNSNVVTNSELDSNVVLVPNSKGVIIPSSDATIVPNSNIVMNSEPIPNSNMLLATWVQTVENLTHQINTIPHAKPFSSPPFSYASPSHEKNADNCSAHPSPPKQHEADN